MHITMLIAITDLRTSVTSSISATAAAGTITLNVAATLLVGVASTLAVIETTLIVEVGKCVLDSERCVPISGTTD